MAACATAPARLDVVPLHGQSAEQLDRDRWECELEAQRAGDAGTGGWLRVETSNPGALVGGLAGAAVGGGVGAAIGAATGSAGTGAAVGAIAGGTAGVAIGGPVARARERDAVLETFRRCLAGRGYDLREGEVAR